MLYALFHDNVVDVDGRPVAVDAKLIGHYSSLEKARSARARACRRPGFGAFARGFRIELVECMDGCNGEPERVAVVYRNYLSRIDRDACVECWFSGYFLSAAAAERALAALRMLPRFSSCSEDLATERIVVDADQWTEGFVTDRS